MIKNKKLLSFLLAIQLIFQCPLGFSDQNPYLSPISVFAQKIGADVETIAVIARAISFLKQRQRSSEFLEEIRALGYDDDALRIEGDDESSQAIRFKSAQGGWFRIGRESLSKNDPGMGFFIPSQSEQVDGFWVESFEKTVPVEILVPGVAIGVVVKIEVTDFEGHVPKDSLSVDVAIEKDKLARMKAAVLARYDEIIESSTGDAKEIAETEKIIIEYELVSKIEEMISPSVTAHEALMRVINKIISEAQTRFKTATPDGRRIIQTMILTAMNTGQAMMDVLEGVDRMGILDEKIARIAQTGQKVILVGKILPTHFKLAKKESISGLLTDQFEPKGSHNIILAKGSGIPFARKTDTVSSFEKGLNDGDTVILEMVESDRSGKNHITLEPDASLRSRVVRRIEEKKKYRTAVSGLKSKTRDNRNISLHLNAAIHEEFPWGKGEFPHLGLVRSDFTYLQSDSDPDLEFLKEEYRSFFGRASRAGVRKMNFRTFDLDLGDKSPPYFRNPDRREGIDFSLNDPQGKNAFKTQVAAIFLGLGSHLSEGGAPIELNLLFPKLKDIEEYRAAVRLVTEIYDQLREENEILEQIKFNLGIMVETKEALDKINTFIGEVDFINVGTNDLTLSLFRDQVSRTGEKGKATIGEYHHKVLEALVKIVKAAQSHPNIQRQPPICVCGELASYPEYGLFLLGLGYRGLSLSMPYEQVLDMKVNIAAHDYDILRRYAEEVLTRVKKAGKLKGSASEKAYEDLKAFIYEKRAEAEQDTLEYLLYDWGTLNLSLKSVLETLSRVYDALKKISEGARLPDEKEQRKKVAEALLEQGVVTPYLAGKIEQDWDLEEVLGILEVWAYRKLINQGTFFVYRAKKIGNDHWIRVLPTGEDSRWVSRYDRRIIKEEGQIWIRTGPDTLIPATKVSMANEPDSEVYEYSENGQIFYARNLDVRGVPYTYVKAGPEKDYMIKLFNEGKPQSPNEKLYEDQDASVKIVHIPDWLKHPVFRELPYESGELNRSALFFLLNDDSSTGEMTWGQNMARAGYGNLFEDDSRILEMLIEKMKIVDKTMSSGRAKLELIKALMEVNRRLEAEVALRQLAEQSVEEESALRLAADARNRDLEALLRYHGLDPARISDPRQVLDRAA